MNNIFNQIKRVFLSLWNLNLYLNSETIQKNDQNVLIYQIKSTRVYLCLMFISLNCLILFTMIPKKEIKLTILNPSLSIYNDLESKHIDSLICLCDQIAITYDHFLSMEPIYHQVCSSEIVSNKWIESLYNENIRFLSPLDFRVTAASQFRLLSFMCKFVKSSTDDTIKTFLQEQLISGQLISRPSFRIQVEASFSELDSILDSSLRPNLAAPIFVFIINQNFVHSSLNTNSFHLSVPGSDIYRSVQNYYPKYDNASFANNSDDFNLCGVFDAPTYKAGIYSWANEFRSISSLMDPKPAAIFEILGMRVGCLPYDGLSKGNLQCFYDELCINNTAKLISNLRENDWPRPLNKSMVFKENVSLNSIFEKQMIEEWHRSSSFDNYFNSCSPFQCEYKIYERNSYIYLITFLLALIGSLTLLMKFVSPHIVTFYYKIRNITKETVDVNSTSNVENKKNWRIKLSQLKSRLTDVTLKLNLFKHDVENVMASVYATRVYIVLLMTGVVILTLNSALTEYTRTVLVLSPSLDTFERLHEMYSETLICPCSQVSISHAFIMKTSSRRLHQVCSSAFVSTDWIEGYFTIKFHNQSESKEISENDFRRSGKQIFQIIWGFCRTLNLLLRYSEANFLQDDFVTAHSLSRSEFDRQVKSLIKSFQSRTIANITFLLRLVRTWLMATGLPNGISYKSLKINETWIIFHQFPGPTSFNECACSVEFNCPDSDWSSGRILCQYGDHCAQNSTVWNVPGFVKGCSVLENILSSDLRCFYNETCFQKLLSMYNVDLSGRMPLPESVYSLQILNTSNSSKFSAASSIGTLVEQLMLEEWNIEGPFDNYYWICSPQTCSYSIRKRLDVIYVLSTILGLFGGLSLALKLIIPRLVQIIYLLLKKFQRNNSNETIHFNNYQQLKKYFSTINLFREECSTLLNENAEQLALVASRIYMIILPISLATICLFNGLDGTNVSYKIENPSIEIFNELNLKYSSTLSCPCQQISIRYDEFINLVPTYHQVCSSDLISLSWTRYLYGFGNKSNFYFQLDRPILSRQHQTIGWLCNDTRTLVELALFDFYQTNFVTSKAISRLSYESRITQIIQQFLQQVPLNFRRFVPYMTELIHGNLLPTLFNTNWILEFGNSSTGYLIRSFARQYSNGTCNCVVSNKCNRPMRIGPPSIVLPGLVVGCSPVDGLLMSTLECFYDENCISTILEHLEYFTEIDGSFPSDFVRPITRPVNISPLNKSKLFRFSPNSTVKSIADELFIEEWTQANSFKKYFSKCSPQFCRYEMIQRNSWLFLLTSLLSVYGGLTVTLRFGIWNLVKFFRKQTTVEPFHTNIF